MWDRDYLRERIGSMRQLSSIRRAVLDDDKGRGMRVWNFDNGGGLTFSVYPDRGMDIGEASYKGTPLAWITPNGPVAPAFYESEGINWLRSWGGGMLTGCGLMNVGGPNCSGGESHGLHGRLSHTPAGEVNSRCFWNDRGEYVLEAEGHIRVSRVFGKNLALVRRISTVSGSSTVTIEDTVENEGFRSTPLMQLYHMNFGWPLVDDGSVLEAVSHKVIPQNDIAAAGLGEWNRMTEPEPGFVEQVFYHDIPAGEDGMAAIRLRNQKLGLMLEVSYRTRELPWLVQWKQMGQGEYVLGLEPANCFPEGQAAMIKRGMLRTLAPGERVSTLFRISLSEI